MSLLHSIVTDKLSVKDSWRVDAMVLNDKVDWNFKWPSHVARKVESQIKKMPGISATIRYPRRGKVLIKFTRCEN